MSGAPVAEQNAAESTRWGGKKELRVRVLAGADVADALLSRRDGGGKVDVGIRELITEAYGRAFRVDVVREPPLPAPLLLVELEGTNQGERTSALVEAAPDVVVLGVSSDLDTDDAAFRSAMQRAVRILKDDVGCHVIVQNASSVDPEDTTINYHGIPDPLAVRIHRLNLRLLELSMLEGISILDADRVIAELGAGKHVAKVLDYSADACEAIARELVRVLGDYGFFEERPLVPQLGRRTASGAD
jgi:hypothetical protein